MLINFPRPKIRKRERERDRILAEMPFSLMIANRDRENLQQYDVIIGVKNVIEANRLNMIALRVWNEFCVSLNEGKMKE